MLKETSCDQERIYPPLWEKRLVLGRWTLNLVMRRNVAAGKRERRRPLYPNHIATLRRERGLSSRELAPLLLIHPSTLEALEGGTYLPSLELTMRVSAFFHVPVETIFSSFVAD